MNKTTPPSVTFTTTAAAVIIAFCIIGLIGNILVILAIFRKKRLRTLPNSFIASLSVADIFYIVFGAAPGASAYISRGWSAGMDVCIINQYVILGFCQISLMHMVCIAVSRFIHIVHYTSAARVLNKRNVILAISITWLLLFVLITTYHFLIGGSDLYLDKAFRCVTLTSDSLVGMTVVLYLICFVLPSVIVVVCYVKIRTFVAKKKLQLSLHLRKKEAKTTQTSTGREADDKRTVKAATESRRQTGDKNTSENINTTADDNSTINGEINKNNKTILTIPNATGSGAACSSRSNTVDLETGIDAQSLALHSRIRQKSIDISDTDNIRERKNYITDQTVDGIPNAGAPDRSDVEAKGNNYVKFTEISAIKHNNVDSTKERNTIRCHKRNCRIGGKSSRSIRMKTLRFIRKNPHFRSISDEELQLNRMMAVVFVIIWIGYVPYPIVRFFDGDNLTVSGTVYVTTTVILYVAGCLNPIIYGVMHKRFRAAFVEMLTFKLIKLSRIGIMLNDSTNSDVEQGSTASKIRSQCE